jgi:uncharacterized membrane protein YoaK (UPF0700 family)
LPAPGAEAVRISPLVRGLLIIAAISAVIVVLNLETALVTANLLISVVFFLAIAFAAYMLWRDFGRREISLWPARQQYVFYGSIGLALVDIGWWFVTPLSGRNALVFFVVLGACVYAAVRTWRRQHSYGS